MRDFRAGRRSIGTWLVLAAVGLLAVLAVFDALRRAPSPVSAEEPAGAVRLTGGELPAAGLLEGTIVFSDLEDCRPRELSLQTLSVGPAGPSAGCNLWVPPRGGTAAVSLASALGGRGSVVGLFRLGGPPEIVEELGVVRGRPSWSDDGTRVAWCTAENHTVVLDVESGLRNRVDGCHPTIAPDGSVLTRPAALLTPTLLRDGEVLLGEEELLRPFSRDSEGPLDVVGFDVRADGLLAVVTVRFESGRRPSRRLQLWRDRQLEQAIPLPELSLPAGAGRLGDHVEFAPGGRAVAVAFPRSGMQMVVVDLELGEVVHGPVSQHGFAWSPDGAWLAISNAEEIRILGSGRGEPVYVLPLGAEAIAWR